MVVKPIKYEKYHNLIKFELEKDRKYHKKKWWHLFNWWAAAWAEMAIHYEVEEKIGEELKKRNFCTFDAWHEYPQYHQIIEALQKVFDDVLWEFNVVFIPDDDYSVIGKFLTGDLIEIEGIYKLEDCLGFDRDTINLEPFAENTTMLEYVKYIYKIKEELSQKA